MVLLGFSKILLYVFIWWRSAQAQDQTTPKGLHFIGVGYNILRGNPEGGDLSNGGVDPGLLLTRKVFQLTYKENKVSVDKRFLIPDQINFSPRHSCVQSNRKEVFSGTKSYQKKLTLDVQTSGGADVILAKFAFSQSARFEKIQKDTFKYHNVFYEEKNVCNLGRARYLLDLAYVRHYPVTHDFAAAVCSLPTNYSVSDYVTFIDRWGTHIVVEVDLGTRRTERFKSSQTDFTKYAMENIGTAVSASGAYKGYSGSLSVDMESFRESMTDKTKFGENKIIFTSGGKDLPEPIGTKVMTIDNGLDYKFYKSILTRCALSKENLKVRRANLIKTLMEYPTLKMAVKPTDPPIRIPITWPKGTYGLPMTVRGCPQGMGFLWHAGTRYQDTENNRPENRWSNPYSLAGHKSSTAMDQRFCMKTQAKGTEYDLVWPKGQYCLFQKGPCPEGLREGYIRWDDEDGNNRNRLWGQIPDGIYDKNTKIFYCCRTDGYATNAINLPTDRPFVLFKSTTHLCQHVHGMQVRSEYFYWDTEDTFTMNRFRDPHPYGYVNKNIRVDYCYYYK